MIWPFIILLFSCTDNTGYNNQFIPIEENTTEDFSFQSFSTRLSNNLLIAGTRCRFGDSADSEGRTYACEEGEWLVVVDNINFCTPEGCTSVRVRPMIASLLVETNDPVTTFMRIAPDIPVRGEIQSVLGGVLLRVDRFGRPVVVFR